MTILPHSKLISSLRNPNEDTFPRFPMRKLLLLFLPAIIAASFAEAAQDVSVGQDCSPLSGSDSLAAIVDSLESEAEALRADSARLAASIDSLEHLLAGGTKKLKEERNQLADSLAAIEAAHAADFDKASGDAAAIAALHAAMSARADSLRALIGSMADYSAVMKDGIVEDAVPRWLATPYAAIDIAALSQDISVLEMMTATDSRHSEALDRLTELRRQAALYHRGTEAVGSPYDAEAVESAARDIAAMLPTVDDSSHAADLSGLERHLREYSIHLESFCEVIKAVDKAVAGAADDTTALSAALSAIDVEEDNNGYITDIRSIPWLSTRYDEYLEQLRRSPRRRTAVAEEILSIQPTL